MRGPGAGDTTHPGKPAPTHEASSANSFLDIESFVVSPIMLQRSPTFILNPGWYCPLGTSGNIWTHLSLKLEEVMPLAFSGQRPGMLPTITQCPGQPLPQRIIQPQMSIGPMLWHPAPQWHRKPVTTTLNIPRSAEVTIYPNSPRNSYWNVLLFRKPKASSCGFPPNTNSSLRGPGGGLQKFKERKPPLKKFRVQGGGSESHAFS